MMTSLSGINLLKPYWHPQCVPPQEWGWGCMGGREAYMIEQTTRKSPCSEDVKKNTKLEVKIDSVDFIRADLSPALVSE